MFAAIKKWLGAVAGVLVAAAAAVIWYRARRLQRKVDAAENATARAKAAEQRAAVATDREDVENETSKLPDAPPVALGDAPRGTAAGRLRRWLRDLPKSTKK